MKQKVWILNHYAGNMLFDQGGRHYNFAKFLKQAGYDPVVFCANSKHFTRGSFFGLESLYRVETAPELDIPFLFVKAREYVGNGKQRIFNMWEFFVNVQKTAMDYAKNHGKPDVIYASSVHPLTLWAGIRLAKRFGVECVCEVRDLWPESLVAYGMLPRNNPATKLLYLGEKWLYKKCDRLIMTWPGGWDYIEERGWDKAIPKEKVTHIDNGVDLTAFLENAKQPLSDPDLESSCFKAIYTGSIRKVNNLQLLVDAAKILHNRGNEAVKILVYGDGDQRESLTKQAEHLPNIIFKGRVAKSAVPAVLSRGDVSILHNSRSVLDKYGQSQNKFFEYLAAGKPVLMTYSVGHSVCKARNCGLELEDQTPEAVADALEQLSRLSSEEYAAYCRSAAEAAVDYDFANLTKKLIAVLEGGK